MSLLVVPTSVQDAKAFVAVEHSHHDAPLSGLVAVAVEVEGRRVCVAILGRPVARALDAIPTCAEVTRLASDASTPHAASKALGAIARAAWPLGYRRLVSYTLLGEAGTCYRAAGWRPVAHVKGREWSCASRHRGGAAQPGDKVRWETGPDALARDKDVDALVRSSAGRIELPARREDLPLFGEGPRCG
jgi:hypothetical protein